MDRAARLGEHWCMRSFAALAALTLTLAGCAASGPRDAAPLSGVAKPAPIVGLDWMLTTETDSAWLAYGTPESDDLQLGLRCHRGDDEIEVTHVAERGARGRISVFTDREHVVWPAQVEDEPMSGGKLLTARVRKNDPGIQGLRRNGWLAVEMHGETVGMAPQPGATAVPEFFNWCG